MAIVKMTKFNLLSFKENEEILLKRLQDFEYVHFSDFHDDEEDVEKENKEKVPERLVSINYEIDEVKRAIKILKPFDSRPTGIKGLKEGNPDIEFSKLGELARKSGYENTMKEVFETEKEIEEIRSNEAKMRSDIADTENLIDLKVSPYEVYNLKMSSGMIFSVSKKNDEKIYRELNQIENAVFKKVGESKEDYFFFLIFMKEDEDKINEILKENGASKVSPEYDEVPLSRKKRLEALIIKDKERIKEKKEHLENISVKLKDLELAFEYLMNKRLRIMADENILDTRYLNIITGYIPTELLEEFNRNLEETLGKDHYYLETKNVEEDDNKVPTLLKNNTVIAPFEGLTTMYGVPKYDKLDPTPVMAPFYIMFFGMMVADAGYGLLMLIGTLIALKKFNLSDSMRSSMKFFNYISYSVIFFGILYGSYFSLNYNGWRLLDPSKDFITILIISIAMGAIHMFLALAIKAYSLIKEKDYKGALFDVGFWYMALIGAIVMGLSKVMNLGDTYSNIAKWIMIVGMIGIVLFSARDTKSKPGRIAGGLYNLYGMSGWIGDFVSYSRLMALGLSGGFIGMAINMIAGMMGAWYLKPFAAIIFIFGHIFNLFIGALGAYVHTARLSFVEFFGKFFDGGGKKFKKFRSDEKYINYK